MILAALRYQLRQIVEQQRRPQDFMLMIAPLSRVIDVKMFRTPTIMPYHSILIIDISATKNTLLKRYLYLYA